MKVWRKIHQPLKSNPVPLVFGILCLFGVIVSGKSLRFLLQEVVTRLARNWILVLSLLVPVSAGLGLNFSMVLGAMAGQTGIIVMTHLKVPGMLGFLGAFLVSLPIAVVLGFVAGNIMNRAKGREMIAGMMLGFFMNGVYQMVFLFMVGKVIPMKNPDLMLPQGFGLRNTVELKYMKYALDSLLTLSLSGLVIPLATFALIALVCLGLNRLYKTKLGQDFRAVGQDMHVASVAGIDVNRTRLLAVVIATVLASLGQLVFLQNIGTLNTYNSHEQVATFAIASLLLGGATVTRATVGQALAGTLLFHLLFIVSPYAGQSLMGSPQVGEYFRVFVAYGIIAGALVVHAWEAHRRVLSGAKRDVPEGEANRAG